MDQFSQLGFCLALLMFYKPCNGSEVGDIMSATEYTHVKQFTPSNLNLLSPPDVANTAQHQLEGLLSYVLWPTISTF